MNIPQLEIPPGQIRVAAYDPFTEVHGPGKRFALWLQGCKLSCQGCVNPEMLPEQGGTNMRVTQVTSLLERQINSDFPVEGVTFMGGEPMIQAAAIAEILQWCKGNTNLNSIIFSGYTLEHLQKDSSENVRKVLEEIDTLIDGPYIQEIRSMADVRGSSNQKIHHLNKKRLERASFARRSAEFGIDGTNAKENSVIQTGFTPEQIKIC